MKKVHIIYPGLIFVLFAVCEKNEASNVIHDFLTCKIDGEPFGKEYLTEAPYAEYDATASPKHLRIIVKTSKKNFSIYVYDQSDYTGTFRFGDEVPGFHYHYGVITDVPGDYTTDSWFATGKATWGGISGGRVASTRYDTLNHHIEGTFEGTFYNPDHETIKLVTEGKFSLPLITLNNP